MRKVKKAKARKAVARKRKVAPRIEAASSPFKVDNPEADPYFIPADQIPKGMEYQWVAISVMGESVDAGWLENFHRTGWKRVPARRHPSFSVALNGLRLYERKIPKDRPALTEANLAAIKMSEEMDMRLGRDRGERSAGIRIMPELWNESAPYEHVSSLVPPIQIDVTIPIWLSGRYQDAANALGLTNEEYAQRRIILHLRGDIDGLLMPADGAFDLIQKSFHWQRDPR